MLCCGSGVLAEVLAASRALLQGRLGKVKHSRDPDLDFFVL
jgi:hypothetical protein